jgi:DNA-3-methyladenine glycosylase II
MTKAELKVAQKHLSKDPIMKELIETLDAPIFTVSNNLFFDIVDSIVSQQLSTKAAATILKRFLDLFETKPAPTPEEILQQSDESMRAAGLSFQKIKYVKGLSQAIINKELDLKDIPNLSDEEIINELTKIKGIGRWTAEMILMFSLHRPDIFSIGDLGLRNAVSKLYSIDRDNLKEIEKIAVCWSPFRTLASRYLWKSLNNTPSI